MSLKVSSVTTNVLNPLHESVPLMSRAAGDCAYISEQLAGDYGVEDVVRIAKRIAVDATELQRLATVAESHAEYAGEESADKTVAFLRYWSERAWQMYGEARKAIMDAEFKRLGMP